MTSRGNLRHLLLCATLLVACNEGPTGPDVGKLSINITGLPAGAAAAVTVEGPDGFSQSLSAGTTLDAVPSGEYIVSADSTAFTEDLFAPARGVDTLRVRRGREVRTDIAYVLASGSIALAASGLPAGDSAEALLEGPQGARRTIAVPGTARGLLPGTWRVSYPRRYVADGHGYDAAVVDTIQVLPAAAAITRSVQYALATGAIEATFNGLPTAVAPVGIVFGRFGIVATLNANGARTGFDPGEYTIAPQNVFDGDIRYSATSVTQTVSAGLVPRAFVINYVPRSGRLTLAASGLPAGSRPSARVTGPAGFDTTLVLGDTLKGLPTGTYAVQGALVDSAGVNFTAASLPAVAILGAQTTTATLAYSRSAGFSFSVDAAYAVQAVQRYDGSVPLIANREALVRVFARASSPNAFSASVRVRILQGAVTTFEQVLAATSPGIPTSVDESTFQGSWRVTVPAAAIQPGAQLQVTIDPNEVLPDSSRSDNTLTRPLTVRALPNFRARFVPIRFAAGGAAGNVTAANSAAFLQLTRDMLPVADVDVDLGAEYVTQQPRLTTSNSTVWQTVLGELEALRVAEGTRRYYMGIIPVGYTSGIAGIGYLGAPSSLTWDYLPSGSEVLAHELGHNFNRRHAPCGNPSGIDAAYPHVGGNIGAFGWDSRQSRLRAPTVKDIMSYCDDPWVSDYTWRGVLDFRVSTETPAAIAANVVQPVLLVRGRITSAGVQLEPGFTLDAVPALPEPGPHRLELRDDAGALIYGASFRASMISDLPSGDTEHFTFAIPLTALSGRSLASLMVSTGSARSELRRSADAALRVAPMLSALRASDGSVRVSDSDPATRGMIIREAGTGRIISIVSGREATLPSDRGELEVLSSDGVRSTALRIRPQTR